MFSIVSVEIYISFKLHATLEDLVFARPPKKWQFIAVITQVISPTLALHPPPARSFGVRSCCLGIFWEHRFEIRRVSQGYRKRARRKKWLKNHLQVVGGWLKWTTRQTEKYERQNGFSELPQSKGEQNQYLSCHHRVTEKSEQFLSKWSDMDRTFQKNNTPSNGWPGSHEKTGKPPCPSKARDHYINHWGFCFLGEVKIHLKIGLWQVHHYNMTPTPTGGTIFLQEIRQNYQTFASSLIWFGRFCVCVFCLPRCWAISSEEEDDVRCSWTLGLVFLECAPFAALQKKERKNGWEWNEWMAWLDQKIREFCFGCL